MALAPSVRAALLLFWMGSRAWIEASGVSLCFSLRLLLYPLVRGRLLGCFWRHAAGRARFFFLGEGIFGVAESLPL